MNLKLIGVVTGGGSPEAVVETPIGLARLRLHATRALTPGEVYDFEFTIDEVLVLGENAHRTDSRVFAIFEDEDSIGLRGWVDAIDDDGLIYFRLGVDSLTMIEAEPDQFEVGDWLQLVLAKECIVAYI